MRPDLPPLGVILVCFNGADVILDCLESLLATRGTRLHIVIVDNASEDDSPRRIRDWASGAQPYAVPASSPIALTPCPKPVPIRSGTDHSTATDSDHDVTLIEAGVNGGFAAGVNIGLAQLLRDPALDRIWILNPDSIVAPETPARLAAAPGGFALMGNRVLYIKPENRIQIDGGRIDWRTGVTHNVNRLAPANSPGPEPGQLDFIMGASMVASRAFIEAAGPMPEDYFLYYEEVDWALRRGSLPLAWCADAPVYHHAGAAIGSVRPGQAASPFSAYFLHRGRIRFLRRHRPGALVTASLFTLAKAGQMLAKRHLPQAGAILRAGFGLGPPASVRARLSPQAAARAFGRRS